MASTRRVKLEGILDGDEAQDEAAADFAEANRDEGGELFRITDEIRGTAGVKLMIVRTYPNTPDMAGHVGDLTPSEFSIERMRELYGPGRYRVRVVGPKGFLPGGGPVHIARTAPEAPSGSGGGFSDFAGMMKALNEREDARRREDGDKKWKLLELTIPGAITLLAAVLGRSAPAGPDLATLITALKPPPAPSITDLTTSLASLKTLTEKPEGSDKLDTLLKVFEFAKTMSSDGGNEKGESNWIDLFRDLLKEGPAMVQPLLENLKARHGEPITPIRADIVRPTSGPFALPPASSGVTAPLSASEPTMTAAPLSDGAATIEGDDMDMMAFAMPLIRGQLAKLLVWAQENRRVELYAEVLLEELPQLVHKYVTPEQALEYLNHEHWFEIVTGQLPALHDYRAWLDAMRLELIEIITEQLKQPTTDETEVDSAE